MFHRNLLWVVHVKVILIQVSLLTCHGDLPAPQSPDGRLPWTIQSRFILDTRRSAAIETSCVLSPNSNLCANLWMYRQGSANTERGNRNKY